MTLLRATVSAALGAAIVAACATPPRMCASEADCGAQAACVAGRCVPRGATAAITTARRLVAAPVDVGWIDARGDAGGDVAVLGRWRGRLFLRYALPLPPEAEVLEAYVLLDRAPSPDADPVPLSLHAERVTSRWDGRSLRWATQPERAPANLPVTRVAARGTSPVRVDVRALVERWRRRDPGEHGVAILADGDTPTGVGFALGPIDAEADAPPALAATAGAPPERQAEAPPWVRQAQAPRLEVYVK